MLVGFALLHNNTRIFLHFSCRRRNREEERESLKIILLVCMVVGLQHYFKNCICLKPCLLSSRAASTTSKAKNRCKIHNAKKTIMYYYCGGVNGGAGGSRSAKM